MRYAPCAWPQSQNLGKFADSVTFRSAFRGHRLGSAIVEELSQLSIVRDELKKSRGRSTSPRNPPSIRKLKRFSERWINLRARLPRPGERIETGPRSSMRSRDLAFSLTLYPNQRTHNDEIEIVLGDHQLGEGVSHCQRANHSSSSVTLSVFCSVGHCRSSRVFPSNRSSYRSDSRPLLSRNRTELAGGLYLRSNRATLP